MKNVSVLSPRHVPLLLNKVVGLAQRPLRSGWAAAYVLPLLIPVIIVIVRRATGQKSKPERPAAVSDTLSVGRFTVVWLQASFGC